MTLVAGVDEAGRGPLAGPVIAAAVILPPRHGIDGLADSKTLSRQKRETLFTFITERCVWAVGRAEVEEIDQWNILQASLLAMQRAVNALKQVPVRVLVDGNKAPALPMQVECIIKGDQKEAAISAASIIAKVSRDWEMLTLHEQYPQYGFAQHKGYPTKAHLESLAKHGVCPLHRRSFAPVQRLLNPVRS